MTKCWMFKDSRGKEGGFKIWYVL